MDSCSQVRMLFAICIPLSKPMISTVTLFSALGYWNDWVNGLYYLIRNKKVIYDSERFKYDAEQHSVFKAEFSSRIHIACIFSSFIRTSYGNCSCVCAFDSYDIFQFFQKQFVQGIVIGGVKG